MPILTVRPVQEAWSVAALYRKNVVHLGKFASRNEANEAGRAAAEILGVEFWP
jgi:hypothetical protein